MSKYYAIQYAPDGKGCPYYLAGDYTPAEWEFDNVEPDPLGLEIVKNYELSISDPSIKALTFDYYDNEPRIVSKRFLKLCEDFQVAFRAIRLNISIKSGRIADREYYIFLAADNVALLDQAKSVYEVEHVVETGAVMIDRSFPPNPVYSKIEKFRCKNADTPALFYCIEIMRLACAEEFRQRAIEEGLAGIKFTPIDESYVYDLWGEN